MSGLLEVVLHDGVGNDGVRHLGHQVQHQARDRVDPETLHRIEVAALLVGHQRDHRGDHLLGRRVRKDVRMHQAYQSKMDVFISDIAVLCCAIDAFPILGGM